MIAINKRHRDVDPSVIRSRRDVARKALINATRNVRIARPFAALHQLVDEVRRQATRVMEAAFQDAGQTGPALHSGENRPDEGARTFLIMTDARRFARSTPGK